MPGKNLLLKPGQVLFSKGEDSNGMYLVRKGELQVYLEQQGREVPLANVSGGGMIGEMALFDQKPRSASVKAVSDVEITQITNDDFRKLIKQIPRWFTSLMITLSGRLRATNERLQSMEAKTTDDMEYMQSILKIIYLIDLIWHKEGIKEGKVWTIEQDSLVDNICLIFSENPMFVRKIIKVLIAENILGSTKNSYRATLLTLSSRGTLKLFLDFFSRTIHQDGQASFPEPAIDMLKAANFIGEKSAYEKFSASMPELITAGKKLHLRSYQEWNKYLYLFKSCDRKEFEVVSGSSGLTVQCNKKSVQRMVIFHTVIRKLHESGNS